MAFSFSQKNEFYLVYGLAAALAVISLVMFSPLLLLASSSLIVVAVLLLNSGHIVNDLLLKRLGIVEVAGSYRLGRNMGSVFRKQGDCYKAVSVAIMKPKPNSRVKAEAMKDLLDSINEHFEFSIELSEVSKEKIVENLRTRLRLKEISLSRVDAKSYDKVNALKRQIDAINYDISSLTSGGRSFEFVIAVKSMSISQAEDEAVLYAVKGIEALANKFSAALGLDYEILYGERLLGFFGA